MGFSNRCFSAWKTYQLCSHKEIRQVRNYLWDVWWTNLFELLVKKFDVFFPVSVSPVNRLYSHRSLILFTSLQNIIQFCYHHKFTFWLVIFFDEDCALARGNCDIGLMSRAIALESMLSEKEHLPMFGIFVGRNHVVALYMAHSFKE